MKAFVSSFLVLLVAAAPVVAQKGRSQRRPLSPSPASGVGPIAHKPGGGLFFVDPNHGGEASEVRITALFWGRLVDVHGLDPHGGIIARPAFSDLVIDENVQSDGVNYLLETNPVTQKTRLVILQRPGAAFFDLVIRATQGLPIVTPKGCHAPAPFSVIPRNATLVVQLDDLLEENPTAASLFETVKVLTGYPPNVPFAPRLVFDPNHGGVAGGAFHPTRVLIDMTVGEFETFPGSSAINPLGLPASLPTLPLPNVKVRIPTRIDPGSGQFAILTNLAGAPLATEHNGPVDPTSPTLDVLRALRSGNGQDLNNGFLLDLDAPQVLGSWPVVVEAAADDPHGRPGFEFIIDLRLTTTCRQAPAAGDVLVPGSLASSVFGAVQLTGSGERYDPTSGRAVGVPASLLVAGPVPASALLGNGLFHTTYDPASAAPLGCWLAFNPSPGAPPAGSVDPAVQVLARFSEPMLPESVKPFDTFRLVRGDATVTPDPTNLVVGTILPASDLTIFANTPLLPLAHQSGTAETYHVELTGSPGVTDLAGNELAHPLPSVEFTLDPNAPTEANGGIALRFASPDEFMVGAAAGVPDLRGQFFYDLLHGGYTGIITSRE